MKQLFNFLFLTICFLTSCSSEPVGPVTIGASAGIDGTWKLDKIEITIDEQVFEVSQQGQEDNFYLNSSYAFNQEENMFVFTFSDGEVFEGTFEYDEEGKKLIIVEEDEGEEYITNFEVDLTSDKLTLSSGEINVENTDIFNEDSPEVFFLFEAIFLLEDKEDEIIDRLGGGEAKNMKVEYFYIKA